MKTIIFAMSMLTLSCSATVGLPEGDITEVETPTFLAPTPAESAEVKPDVPPSSPGSAEECRVCNGDWGVHGISETASCNCRTTDVGKRCTDGADCQGLCVANADAPEYDVVDVGPPARGFLVGRCSEYFAVLGCSALVVPGARHDGPVSVAEPPTVFCAD